MVSIFFRNSVGFTSKQKIHRELELVYECERKVFRVLVCLRIPIAYVPSYTLYRLTLTSIGNQASDCVIV